LTTSLVDAHRKSSINASDKCRVKRSAQLGSVPSEAHTDIKQAWISLHEVQEKSPVENVSNIDGRQP